VIVYTDLPITADRVMQGCELWTLPSPRSNPLFARVTPPYRCHRMRSSISQQSFWSSSSCIYGSSVRDRTAAGEVVMIMRTIMVKRCEWWKWSCARGSLMVYSYMYLTHVTKTIGRYGLNVEVSPIPWDNRIQGVDSHEGTKRFRITNHMRRFRSGVFL